MKMLMRWMRGIAFFSTVVCICCAVMAAEPQFSKVFVGGEEGYLAYRIPSVVITSKGTLLAFCEGRKISVGDGTPTDLVLKRSFDGGKTWGPLQILVKAAPQAAMDPTAVVDRETGLVWLVYDRWPAIGSGEDMDKSTAWVTCSSDEGETWSEPRDITATTQKPEWVRVVHGPGIGIQTRSGRLVIPCTHGDKQDRWDFAIYSDDHGKSWRMGCGQTGPGVTEPQIVELANGNLMLNMRDYGGRGCRIAAVSKDGGDTWSEPFEVPELTEPSSHTGCQASILRYTLAEKQGKNRLLFCNPADKNSRSNGTVRISYDEGATWPTSKTLFPAELGGFAYNCLTVLPDMTIGCLFETKDHHDIQFARFSLEWLSDGRDYVGKTASEIIVDVDLFDEIWYRKNAMTASDVKELITKLKKNGCRTILLRTACHGVFGYDSKLSYPYGFDAEHARTNASPAVFEASTGNLENKVESHIKERSAWDKRVAEVIRDIDPVKLFIREGHEQGIKVFAWIDLFDTGWPGYRSKFLDENPHCRWVGKDGKTYFKEVMDYSWPEAREFMVRCASELLDFGADGIHCSTCCHCRMLPNPHEEDYYGYSEPIVAEYKKRYGVDIRTAENFDQEAWHDLKGEAMVQLYRDLAKVCHDRGKQLYIGLHLGRHTLFTVEPMFSKNIAARYTNHWNTLVDEGIADAFVIGDYEIMSAPNHSYWTMKKDVVRRSGEDLYGWAGREYVQYCRDKTRLYLFSEWLSGEPSTLEKILNNRTKSILVNGFDGVELHEAWNFQSNPANMALLGKLAGRLNGVIKSESSETTSSNETKLVK